MKVVETSSNEDYTAKMGRIFESLGAA